MDAASPAFPPDLSADAAWVRRLARALVGDEAAAEDVAQETLTAALERRTQPSRAWLAAVLRNRVRRWHRGRARRVEREERAARDEALESPDALIVRAESLRRAVELVLALDEPYRRTVLLRYLDELSPAAIAAREGVPVATVKTRLQRALEKLRRAAADREGDPRPAWLVALAWPKGAPHAPWIAGGMLVGTKLQHMALAAAALAVLATIGGYAWKALGPERAIEAARVEAPAAEPIEPSAREAPEPIEDATRVALDEARTEAEDAAALAEPDSLLRGIVVDALDRPIEGAELDVWFDPAASSSVLWWSEPPREHVASGETDADGRFAIELAPGRPHELEVRAAGFAPVLVADCTPGQELRVVVERGVHLRGRVVSAEDERVAVPGGFVRVFHGDWTTEVPVDEQGAFALDDLVPGEIGLLALPRDAAMGRYRNEFPEAGATVEITLAVERGFEVSGRVTDARTGAPIAGTVALTNSDRSKSTRADANGLFRILGVDPDRPVSVYAEAPGHAPAQRLVTLEVAHALDLALEPERVARGRAVSGGGEPLGGADAFAFANEGVPNRDPYTRRVRTGDDGTFELDGLRIDLDYVLVIRAPGHGMAVFDGLVVAGAEGPLELGLLRVEEPALLAGRVFGPSGRPALANLQLEPDLGPDTRASFVGLRPFWSREDGRFALGDLAPGRYRLRAYAEGVVRANIPIELRPGERRTGLEVRIDPGLSIRGAVVDEAGVPLAGVTVSATSERGEASQPYWSATTDARGWFELVGLVPGSYRVTAQLDASLADEHPLETARFRGFEPDRAPIEIVLHRLDRRVSGRVLDDAGEPLADAYVWVERGAEAPTRGVLTDAAGRFELPVREGEAIELVARRTTRLAETNEPMTLVDWEIRRHIEPAEAGEARLTGAEAGARELVLRMPAR